MHQAWIASTDESELERLFKSWRKLSRLETQSGFDGATASTRRSESTGSNFYPWVLTDTATRHRADSARDLLYKLAFWRWSNPNLGARCGAMNSIDAVLYSAFRDLVELTGEEEVMTAFDRRTNLMRNP